MTLRLLRAASLTLAARMVSAVLSFLVFAQVANALPSAAAARVLFFSFALGFSLATFRTFHLISSGITGIESRASRMRRIRASSRVLALTSILLVPATFALLIAQGLGWTLAAGGALMTTICGYDLDLPRAVVGRQPALPVLTAMGGVFGNFLLVSVNAPAEHLCALAFLSQLVNRKPSQPNTKSQLGQQPSEQ